ncbi:hypothetical protein [Litoribrevibacter albus]|uniref:hypothetical protein n=1 Tax=Litoribrevibacter albus TaxID=1473156 RepID=UPI0024E052BD|nr:hypothetical protein [Litoribrevibacter albus]
MFEVIFQGKVIEGKDIQQVRQNLGRMFKADEAKLNALFSGKTVVIKSGLDQATAQKYLAALEKAGAQAEIRSLDSAPAQPPKAQNPASFIAKEFSKPSLNSVAQAHAENQQAKAAVEKEPEPIGIPVPEVTEAASEDIKQAMDTLAKQNKEEPVGQTLPEAASIAPESASSNDFSLAPTGSMILPDAKKKEVEAPNTDHLKVNPMEGYLVDPKPEEAVEVPDTSHLKLKDD